MGKNESTACITPIVSKSVPEIASIQTESPSRAIFINKSPWSVPPLYVCFAVVNGAVMYSRVRFEQAGVIYLQDVETCSFRTSVKYDCGISIESKCRRNLRSCQPKQRLVTWHHPYIKSKIRGIQLGLQRDPTAQSNFARLNIKSYAL